MRVEADGSGVSYTQSICSSSYQILRQKIEWNELSTNNSSDAVACHCLPLLTKMINFITVYFKLASKAFYIYSTSIISFPFLRFLLCRCMRWLHSVFLNSAVVTTSNYFHFSAFSACIAEAHGKLNFIPFFFFHSMATIQKSRTRSTVLFSHNLLGAVFFPLEIAFLSENDRSAAVNLFATIQLATAKYGRDVEYMRV